jgi:hypothetical protein
MFPSKDVFFEADHQGAGIEVEEHVVEDVRVSGYPLGGAAARRCIHRPGPSLGGDVRVTMYRANNSSTCSLVTAKILQGRDALRMVQDGREKRLEDENGGTSKPRTRPTDPTTDITAYSPWVASPGSLSTPKDNV